MTDGCRLDINFPLRELLQQVDDVGRSLMPRAAKIAHARVGVIIRKQASTSILEKLAIKAARVLPQPEIPENEGGTVLELEGEDV